MVERSSSSSEVGDVCASLRTLETIVPMLHPEMLKEVLGKLIVIVGKKFLGKSEYLMRKD